MSAPGYLEHLARESLNRGHWRVALRRVLMLEAAGQPLQDDLRQSLQRLLPLLSASEHRRMNDAAKRWAQMVERA